MMCALEERSVTVRAAADLNSEERAEKIVRGVLVDREVSEYATEYDKIIAIAQAEAA
jgi:hypothetical protein